MSSPILLRFGPVSGCLVGFASWVFGYFVGIVPYSANKESMWSPKSIPGLQGRPSRIISAGLVVGCSSMAWALALAALEVVCLQRGHK